MALHNAAEGRPVDELHDEIVKVIRLTHRVDVDDVRVSERSDGLSLQAEPGDHGLVEQQGSDLKDKERSGTGCARLEGDRLVPYSRQIGRPRVARASSDPVPTTPPTGLPPTAFVISTVKLSVKAWAADATSSPATTVASRCSRTLFIIG